MKERDVLVRFLELRDEIRDVSVAKDKLITQLNELELPDTFSMNIHGRRISRHWVKGNIYID